MGSGKANQQRLLLTAVTALVATPLFVLGAIRTMDGIHTSALHWLDESAPARAKYEEYTEQFEGGSFILISWEGCTVDDPRLTRLEQTIAEYASTTGPEEPLVERVTSGQSLLKELTDPTIGLTPEQATARLAGAMIGPDGRTTCLAVVLSERGGRHRAESYDFLVETTEAAAGLPEAELRIAGPTIDALAVDIESDRSVDYYSGPSAAVSFLACLWCLRSLRYSLAILAVAGFGELMVLGSLHYFGVTMDAVLIVLPPLVFVLTVSSGIHLVNYYYDQVRSGAGEEDAPRLAVRHGWVPCSMAALTTALGLGSLLVSSIVPVATFGGFAAGGVIVAVILLFLTLPGVMSRWPVSAGAIASGSAASTLVVYLVRMAKSVCQRASLITAIGVGCLVVGGVGLAQLRTSIGVGHLFAPDSRVIRDFLWMEEHVADMVPLEVIIRFPADDGLRMIDRLTLLQRIQAEVRQVDSVGGVMSALTFCPEVPTSRGSNTVFRRAQFNARLEASRNELIASHYLHEDERGQSWRVSARVSGVEQLDYEVVLDRLRARVEPLLDDYAARHDFRPTASYTGAMPLVYSAQHALLRDMYYSMLLAFVLVWLVMSMMLTDGSARGAARLASMPKGLWLGALAMLPNLFPIVVVFGAMGWLDWPADIGSTMTACVALGIAVDDTLHFLAWYRRETAKGDPPQLAIRHSFQHCGRAMIQTTVICGCGMLVFGLSDFMPTKRFSLLMFTLLNAALVADLVFLPAILASPLGSVFAVRARPGTEDPEAAVL